MFERLEYLYSIGKLTTEQLDIAVDKSWITADEKQQIISNPVVNLTKDLHPSKWSKFFQRKGEKSKRSNRKKWHFFS